MVVLKWRDRIDDTCLIERDIKVYKLQITCISYNCIPSRYLSHVYNEETFNRRASVYQKHDKVRQHKNKCTKKQKKENNEKSLIYIMTEELSPSLTIGFTSTRTKQCGENCPLVFYVFLGFLRIQLITKAYIVPQIK